MNTTITVYLIDDEPEMVELLSDAAVLAGVNAQGYTQASKFFEQIITFHPGDILVLDLNMPEMDGIEVMRKLTMIDNPPLLILTSGTDIGVLHAAKKLGRAHSLEILATLSKPVEIDKFQHLLEQQACGDRSPLPVKLESNSRAFTVAELQQAIYSDQLTLRYQPQLEISTGKIIGVESLVRWNHPTQGLIPPDHFITFAEQNGLICELTQWVINHAVAQNKQWQEQGLSTTISINISTKDICTLTLPEQITDLLTKNLLDPTMLTLEITESALMGELVTSLDILTRLRLKGISLSIDDFGTGYSSLSQLHKVPFNELKIDRSFVSNMANDFEAHAIVKTCIILGHELNMLVVAEGIENQSTLDILEELGCDVAQGYFIARPMSGYNLLKWKNSLAR